MLFLVYVCECVCVSLCVCGIVRVRSSLTWLTRGRRGKTSGKEERGERCREDQKQGRVVASVG